MKGPSTIQVLLVDDQAMFRQGLRSMLESYQDIVIVGEAWNGEEAVAAVEQLRPDVVIMDINMPKMNGIDATTRIKTQYSDTLVIGFSVNAGSEYQQSMANAGARLLHKRHSIHDFICMQRGWVPALEHSRVSCLVKESVGRRDLEESTRDRGTKTALLC
jgi:chemotaxis response regulator CheB